MKIVSLDGRRSLHPDRAKRLRIAARQVEEMHTIMRGCHQSPIAPAQFVLEARRASRS
jgi:hypothetical protein